jgi:hypothetical protein
MIVSYRQVWPKNQFRFRIPYQEDRWDDDAAHEFISTPSDIKSTVLKLLEGLDDNEWVYWAIDDKYPIKILIDEVQPIVDWILKITDPEISGVCFCRCRRLLKRRYLKWMGFKYIDGPGGIRLLERKNYHQIWVHQFVRVKVLRHLFEAFPDEIPNAKMMDALYRKVNLPADHRLFVTEKNYAVFGEGTRSGQVTKNCYLSIQEKGLDLPEHFSVIDKEIVLGDLL